MLINFDIVSIRKRSNSVPGCDWADEEGEGEVVPVEGDMVERPSEPSVLIHFDAWCRAVRKSSDGSGTLTAVRARECGACLDHGYPLLFSFRG